MDSDALVRLVRRVMMMIGRGLVRLVDDSGAFQVMQLQIQVDELKSEIRRIQNYGLSSNPPLGSENLALFQDGDRSRGVVVASDHGAYRPKNQQEGEVALYAKFGQMIHLRADGGLTIHAARGEDGKYANIDLRGGNVRLYAQESLTFDLAGYGHVWFPDGSTTDYVIGKTGSSTPKPFSVTPAEEPEIPFDEHYSPAPAKPRVPTS